ncbi:hypothetical protein BC943DRAFT_351387 [Umbelopsis sp. AD052]|nr:hypothetical protein BC943DRAFT_351387 [Umbelopsis sp. AD052]
MTHISDDAILELVFNPEAQGLPLEAVADTVDTTGAREIPTDILSQVQELETQGVKLAEEEKLDEALEKLTQAIAICDYYASVYNNRAQVYRLKNDLESAVTDLEQAMKHGVGQPKVLRQAYTQRAIIRKQQGNLEGAQADFERGAKFGNPIAKSITVNENPYAKMCNQIMLEVMGRQVNPQGSNQETTQTTTQE